MEYSSAQSFRSCAYLFSQYFWVLLTLGILVIPVVYPYSRTTKSFQSHAVSSAWNDSLDPVYFAHITDLHVNHVVPANAEYAKIAIEYIESIDPSMVFITGDEVDNLPYANYPKYGTQQPEDWAIYWNLTSKLEKSKILEVAGNHDEFGVFSYDSHSHYFVANKSLSFTNFSVLHTKKTFSNQTFHFLALNPFVYPSAHPPFVFFPRVTDDFMNLFEAELAKVPTSDEVLLFAHYPLNLFHTTSKSTAGKTFYETATDGRAGYFISGHLHTPFSYTQHHPNTLEMVGSALKDGIFGLITFDNGRFVYHTIFDSNLPKSFITNPVPDTQLSSHQIFSEKNTSVRVLSFEQKAPKIHVTGAITGDLVCRRAHDYSAFVCSLPMSLENGHYTVQLSGDLNESVTFTVGSSSPEYNEKLYQTSVISQYVIILVVILVVLGFILIPFKSGWSDEYDDWIERRADSSHWLLATIFGAFTVKWRIQRLPKWLQILLIVAWLWPLVLPLVFLEIEGRIGVIWVYGYFIDGKAIEAPWAHIDTLAYEVIVVLPLTLLCSSLAISSPFKPAIVFDWIVFAANMVADYEFVERFICETASFTFAHLSPCFVFMPAVVGICAVIWRICTTNEAPYQSIQSGLYRNPLGWSQY